MADYTVTYHPMYPHIDEIKITKGVWFQESITLSFYQFHKLTQGLPLENINKFTQKFLAEMQGKL
jgi:hypothetical protein